MAFGLGAGLLAAKARAEKMQTAEQTFFSSYFDIPSEGGRYNLIFRTTTPLDGQLLYLELDGEPFAEVEIPNSGSWTNFVNALAEDLFIPANAEGQLRITYDGSELHFTAFSINSIEI
jgi:hypothetical protein